jgi:mRNA-degrading endonuclease RelE of RelBE toxin-antitoxin system
VTFHEALWSGTALRQLQAMPTAVRDQVEACVQEICRDPFTAGEVLIGDRVRPLYGAEAGPVVVVYEIDEIGEMILIRRVDNRG